MSRAYGTPIRGLDLDAAQTEAMRRTVAGFEYLWRVEAVRYAYVVDAEYDEWSTTHPQLELFPLSVKKWTPTGARLWEGRHVDLRDGAKQYASKTVTEALAQFRRRREAQIWILKKQLARAESELALTCATSESAPFIAARSSRLTIDAA